MKICVKSQWRVFKLTLCTSGMHSQVLLFKKIRISAIPKMHNFLPMLLDFRHKSHKPSLTAHSFSRKFLFLNFYFLWWRKKYIMKLASSVYFTNTIEISSWWEVFVTLCLLIFLLINVFFIFTNSFFFKLKNLLIIQNIMMFPFSGFVAHEYTTKWEETLFGIIIFFIVQLFWRY